MTSDETWVANMVASRICHDLVSPMGAISNGLELLSMAKDGGSAELDLISQSIHSATSRLRLYRIAFGAVSADQQISRAEVLSVLEALERTHKHAYDWKSQVNLSRRDVKLVFLLLLCLETALPWGGRIEIRDTEDGLTLQGMSERLKIEDTLWSGLVSGEFADSLTSARVQFILAHMELVAQSACLQTRDDGCVFCMNLSW